MSLLSEIILCFPLQISTTKFYLCLHRNPDSAVRSDELVTEKIT